MGRGGEGGGGGGGGREGEGGVKSGEIMTFKLKSLSLLADEIESINIKKPSISSKIRTLNI